VRPPSNRVCGINDVSAVIIAALDWRFQRVTRDQLAANGVAPHWARYR
jgi:hypothetical protein